MNVSNTSSHPAVTAARGAAGVVTDPIATGTQQLMTIVCALAPARMS